MTASGSGYLIPRDSKGNVIVLSVAHTAAAYEAVAREIGRVSTEIRHAQRRAAELVALTHECSHHRTWNSSAYDTLREFEAARRQALSEAELLREIARTDAELLRDIARVEREIKTLSFDRHELIQLARRLRHRLRALFWTAAKRPVHIITRQMPWFLVHGCHPPHIGLPLVSPGR